MTTNSRPTHGDGQTATCHLAPMTCEKCGTALEVTCPGCGTNAAPRKHGTIDNRIYQPKPCKRCGNIFQPTGPRSLYCGACP